MKEEAAVLEDTSSEERVSQTVKTGKVSSAKSTAATNRLKKDPTITNRIKKAAGKPEPSLSQESWTKDLQPLKSKTQEPEPKTSAAKITSLEKKLRSQEMQAFIGNLKTLDVRKKHVVKSAAIISNKGGVGKTHVVNNMSFYMAQLGKKVLTIDIDLGNADIAAKLGLYCKNTIIDLFYGTENIDKIIYTTPYGFDLIAGESGNFNPAKLTDAHKNRFIEALRQLNDEYDYIIYDLNAGILSATIDFALAQDYQIIIITPQDIIAGYACIKAAFFRFQEVERAMAERDPSYKPRNVFRPFIILNQVSDFGSGRALYEKILSVSKDNIISDDDFSLNINLLGVITNDSDKIREIELKHELYSSTYGATKIGQCYHFLSHNLMQYKDPGSMEYKTKFKRFVNLFIEGVDEFKYAQ